MPKKAITVFCIDCRSLFSISMQSKCLFSYKWGKSSSPTYSNKFVLPFFKVYPNFPKFFIDDVIPEEAFIIRLRHLFCEPSCDFYIGIHLPDLIFWYMRNFIIVILCLLHTWNITGNWKSDEVTSSGPTLSISPNFAFLERGSKINIFARFLLFESYD